MTCPTTIRASSAPLAMACPGSIRPVTVSIDHANEAGAMGTAAHDVMRGLIEGDTPDIAAYASKHGVDPTELSILAHYGRKAWAELQSQFPQPLTEVALSTPLTDSVMLTGHPDVISILPRERRANILDHKFGRLDVDYSGQLLAYAYLVCFAEPDVQEVDAAVVWMRDQDVERYHWTRAEVMAWRDRFVERAVDWTGTYSPGAHCAHCRRQYECPALLAMAKRDLAVFGGDELAAAITRGLADMPDVQIVDLRRRAKVLSAVLDSLDAATRTVVRQRGRLDSGDGQVLKFVPSERREVDTLRAWPVMTARLADDEIAGCVTVSAGKLDKAVAAKAGRGSGAAAVRELQAALEDARAVTKTTTEQLRLVRK